MFLKIIYFLLILILIPGLNAYSELLAPQGWHEEDRYKETAPEPFQSAKDRLTGFIPFTRNYMAPVYENSRPVRDEITNVFRVVLAKGEYEPLILGLYAVRDLDDISVTIKDVASGDNRILDDQFEIRKIEERAVLPEGRRRGAKRYKRIPSVLELTASADLKAKKTSAFWITVHALKGDQPGDYSGKIVISKGGRELRTLEIIVTILPFELENIPDKTFAVLYTPTNISPSFERNARILLRDIKAHGMTSYSPIVSAWGEPLEFDVSGRPKTGSLLDHLMWADEEGFESPTILNVNKLIRTGRPQNEANYTKFDESVDIPNLKKLVLFFEEERKKNDWPEIVYLPIDEPGCFTDKAGTIREEIAVLVLKTLDELGVRGATTVADPVDNKHRKIPRWKNVTGWWEKMKPYSSVRIYANGYPEGETSLANEMEDARTQGHEVMLYENTSTMGTDPCVSRMYFGYYGWSTGVKGITSWTHPTWNRSTLRHVWADRKEKNRDVKSYSQDKDWEMPPSTVAWEMVREGIDDVKYLYLLQKAVERDNKLDHNYLSLIREMNKVVNSTEMTDKRPQCGIAGKHFTDLREKIVQTLLKLQQ